MQIKCSIVIPVFNEDRYIYKLVCSIKSQYPLLDVIVVDDGSLNPVQESKIKEDCVKVIRNDKNKGKGASIIKGIRCSSAMNNDFSVVMDGDMQHSVEDISKFINSDFSYDMVLGYRSLKKPMPMHRIASNKITSFIISYLAKYKILDSQCGFRRYKNSLFEEDLFLEKGYQFESEVLLKLLKDNSIKQVPVKTIYNDSKSHVNKVFDTLKFARLIIRHIIYVLL